MSPQVSIPDCTIKRSLVKRTFDIIFSVIALIACIPVFVMIAIVIRLASAGPIIYSHERIGRGGKTFRCYKFRTMYPDADARLHELLASDLVMFKEWQDSRKLKKDPRIMPVGRILRKTSMDELPQFWNVLKGDLSIVGPRPLVACEVVSYLGDKASKILSVRPGLTCIWQVSGRNDVSYHKRIQLDEEYIDRQSLLLDVILILRTIPSMVFSKGAY